MRQTRRGFSLVELLIGVVLSSVLIAAVYGLFHLLLWNKSRSNITGMTRRTSMQIDAKIGLRRLTYRLREAIQVLSPAPGTTGDELVFRDLTNGEVRVRVEKAEGRLISERKEPAGWVRETSPVMVDTASGPMAASWPVLLHGCSAVRFTPIGSDCVTVHATLTSEGATGGLLTVVKLRNANLAY